MLPAPSYRTCAEAMSTPLQCPHCRAELFTPLPHRAVNLTRCPHPACHRVMFVCTPAASHEQSWPPRDASAMTLETLLDPPRERGSLSFALFVFMTFVAVPLLILLYATTHLHPHAFACILVMQLPALLLGGGSLYACIVDALALQRRRRRVRAVRQASLSRVDLLPAASQASQEALPAQPTPASR